MGEDGSVGESPVALTEYAWAVRRRWRLVAGCVLGAVVIAAALSLIQAPRYLAFTEVMIGPTQLGTGGRSTLVVAEGEVDTQLRVVTSAPVLGLAAERIDGEQAAALGRQVVVEAVNASRVIRISVIDSDPARAAAVADALAEGYLEYRTELAGSLGSGDQLLRAAVVPAEAFAPRPVWDVGLAAAFGLLLGIGWALLKDRTADALTDDELRRLLGASPVIGRVPRQALSGPHGGVVTVSDPESLAADAYRSIAAAIRRLVPVDDVADRARVVMVTPVDPGDAAALVAANVAVAAASLGSRVVLVDADLRRSAASGVLGLARHQGLSEVLGGIQEVEACLQSAGVERLKVLAAGDLPPNPAELLASEGTRTLLSALASSADLVLVCAAAATVSSDALHLARYGDLILLVTRADRSRRSEVAGLIEGLRQVGAASLAAVVAGSAEDLTVGDASRSAG